MSTSSRLKEARIRAGFKTAAAAAKRLRVPYGTYSGHESGSRGIKQPDIEKYAELFGVSESWLLLGDLTKPTDNSIVISSPDGLVGVRVDGGIDWRTQPELISSRRKNLEPWAQSKPSAKIQFQEEDFRHAVPLIPFLGEYVSCVCVVGDTICSIAERGSVIYFVNDLLQFEENYNGSLCICVFGEGDYYVARPFYDDSRDQTRLSGAKQSPILPGKPKFVMPICFIMTAYARAKTLRQLAKHLLEYADAQPL